MKEKFTTKSFNLLKIRPLQKGTFRRSRIKCLPSSDKIHSKIRFKNSQVIGIIIKSFIIVRTIMYVVFKVDFEACKKVLKGSQKAQVLKIHLKRYCEEDFWDSGSWKLFRFSRLKFDYALMKCLEKICLRFFYLQKIMVQ